MSEVAPLEAYARQSIARGSKSFAAASRLFDRHTRRSVVLLYAWCRHCDDMVDGQDHGHASGPPLTPAASAERLDQLTEATARALRGASTVGPPFAALAEVVRRHGIPARYPLEHLDGFRMDAEARCYRSIDDTFEYCYRVAGVVGVMMAMVMGKRDDATLDCAADLGLAFQLTNIARDVLDDHSAGRLYLPTDWLREEGLDGQDLTAPERREALARVAQRLVDAAEPYYLSARAGLANLPLRSAWAVAAAHGVYRDIGLEVKRRGPAAWDERIATPPRRKLHHLMAGGLTALWIKTAAPGSKATPVPRERLWTRPKTC